MSDNLLCDLPSLFSREYLSYAMSSINVVCFQHRRNPKERGVQTHNGVFRLWGRNVAERISGIRISRKSRLRTAAVRMPRHNSGRFDKNNFGCLEISLQRTETIAILNDAETIQFIPPGFVVLYRAQILAPVKFASLFVVAFNSYRNISVAKLSLVIRFYNVYIIELKANALGRWYLAIQFRFVFKVLKKIKKEKTS